MGYFENGIKDNILFDVVESRARDLAAEYNLQYKKNQSHQVRFVLLQAIGKAVIDCLVSDEDINAAFQFYAD